MSLAAVLNVKTGLVYHKIIYDEDEATYENYKEYINDIKSKVRSELNGFLKIFIIYIIKNILI